MSVLFVFFLFLIQLNSFQIDLGVMSIHLLTLLLLYPEQRSGRHSAPGSHLRRNHETFSMEADKKEKTRHNQFIKTAQPYKPKVSYFQSKRSETSVCKESQGWVWNPPALLSPPFPVGVHQWPEQKEKQRGDCGHRRPRDTPLSLPFQWAAGVGCSDEEAENVTLLLAAWWREHGKGTGGL